MTGAGLVPDNVAGNLPALLCVSQQRSQAHEHLAHHRRRGHGRDLLEREPVRLEVRRSFGDGVVEANLGVTDLQPQRAERDGVTRIAAHVAETPVATVGAGERLLPLLASGPARGDNIEVRDAALRAVDDALVLDADFDFELTPRLAEVVANGVPLYFRVEFELTRGRWYWFDERAASRALQMRLSYHALSRHYRIAAGTQPDRYMLQQNFPTLEDALRVLKRVRNWTVVERRSSLSRSDYDAALRMRLDTTQLPKPFQLNTLGSRDWNLSSDWHRWTVSP